MNLGWGVSLDEHVSTDKLQETVMTIVKSSECVDEMKEAVGADETLILCAKSEKSGPCKVNPK